MQALGLVIFDCDGVLVDSEVISNTVLADLLTREGLPTTLAQARREYQGMLLGEIADHAEAKLGRSLPEGWLARYEHERAEVFRRDLLPVAGAADAVRRVKDAGVAVCVASQGKLEKTMLSLELTGLRHLFPHNALFSAHCVPRGKPHPDLFLQAAAEMCVAAEECVVVEDTPSGVIAAVSANMRVLGLTVDSDEEALRLAGAEPIQSLGALPELLGLS